MKNRVIKGLVAVGLLLTGLVAVNTGSNVEGVYAVSGCNPLPHFACSGAPGGSGGGGNGPNPEQNIPGGFFSLPLSVTIDDLD